MVARNAAIACGGLSERKQLAPRFVPSGFGFIMLCVASQPSSGVIG